MRTITLEAIERAVSSISMTSYPTFRARGIEARIDRANSPYVSRTTVQFERIDPLREGALFASSGKHSLLITTFEPDPRDLVPPFAVNDLVTHWEGGPIPSWIVRPVINRMREFSMCPDDDIMDREMLYVYVLSPVLAGFHFEQPVFFFADREKNEPLVVNDHANYKQGSLEIVAVNKELQDRVHRVPLWLGSDIEFPQFFNHTFDIADDKNWTTDSRRKHLRAVAVMRNNSPHAMMWLWKAGTIWSYDHQDEHIELPEGNWIALHPFPQRGID